MTKLLAILAVCLPLASCSPKQAALDGLQYAQVVLREQGDQLDSASTNIDTAIEALSSGSPPEDVLPALEQASAQVERASDANTTLVGTTEDIINDVSQLKDPEPKLLVALRYISIITVSVLVGYVLFRFVGPILGPILAFFPALLPRPKRDAAVLAAKVDAGELPPEHLVTAIRSDPAANAVYKRQKRKLDASRPD